MDLQHALRRWHLSSLDTNRVAKAPCQSFEHCLDDVMHVATASQRDVQGDAGGSCERRNGVFGELRVERRAAQRQAFGQLDLPHDERATGQIERDLDESLVEWEQTTGESAHTGLVAERLTERFAQADGDIFDGVVRIDMQVAHRGDSQVEASRVCPN